MMRISAFASLVLCLSLAAACKNTEEKSGAIEAASKSAAGLTPQAAQDKFTSMVNQAVSKVNAIKDAPSAEKVAQEVSPMLDQLTQLTNSFAGKLDLSSLGSLEKAVKGVMSKLNDPGVKKALQPLLDKVQGLLK